MELFRPITEYIGRERLESALKDLRTTFPQMNLTVREILDVLWLCSRLPPRQSKPSIDEVIVDDRETAQFPIPKKKPPEEERKPPTPAPSPGGTSSMTARPQTPNPSVSLFAKTEVSDSGMPAAPLKAPGKRALPNTRMIARALRPLMKRVPSRTMIILDEEATAERSAEQGFFEPVMRPATTGWLDLALVVERAGSTRFWARSVEELRATLERHRAFRDVRAWNLVAEESGALALRTWSRQGRRADPMELIEPNGRQMILLVTDCVSLSWSNGKMAAVLRQWSAHGPLSMFQLLPPKLWGRTALRHESLTMLRAITPAATSTALLPASGSTFSAAGTVRIPITTFDKKSLSAWANVVSAIGGATVAGVVLRATVPDREMERREKSIESARALSPADRVRRFDQTAGEQARHLARLFAAAPFPLTPPVMRLIMSAVLPKKNAKDENEPSIIAEVLLSGLLRRTNPAPADPEQTHYQFLNEDIRHRLLDSALASDMLRTMRLKLTEDIKRNFGGVIDFDALIADPETIGKLTISEKEAPLANIGISILRRLGGEYGDMAQKVESRIRGGSDAQLVLPSPPVVERTPYAAWSARNHPRRPRVELAAYLGVHEAIALVGDQNPPGDFTNFIIGLKRWGLPVMIGASIAAARTAGMPRLDPFMLEVCARLATFAEWTLDRSPALSDLRNAIVAAAREGASLRAAPRDPSPKPLTDFAASAVSQTFGEALHASALPAVKEAVTAALLRDLRSESSVVPDRVPFGSAVLVVGSDEYKLPDIVHWTAYGLGRAMARAGCRLVTGGWIGVDHLVARGFTAELEYLGYSPDKGAEAARLINVLEGDTASSHRPDFDPGAVQRTRRWVSATIGQVAAVIIMSGGRRPPEIVRAADHAGVPVFPLPWTGEVSRLRVGEWPLHAGRSALLMEADVKTPEDVKLMIDRAMSLVSLSLEGQVESWTQYNDTLLTLLKTTVPRVLEARVPRYRAMVTSLQRDHARQQVPPAARSDLLATLARIAPNFPDALVHDFLHLCQVERDVFTDRREVIEQFAQMASTDAMTTALAWMTRRFRELAAPLPSRPADLLPMGAREFFGSYENFDRWARTTIGMEADECFFRASIPVEAFRAAEAYVAATVDPDRYQFELRQAVSSLAPRREYVRRFADAGTDAASVVAYVLMFHYDLGIGPVELVSRIRHEAESGEPSRSKTLRQLLLAVARISRAFDASGSRMIARALRLTLTSIRKLPPSEAISPAEIVDHLLSTQLKTAAEENDLIDQQAMETAKTKVSDSAPRLPKTIASYTFSASELEFLFHTGTGEQRKLALSLAPFVFGRIPFEAIREAIKTPSSSAELTFALTIANAICTRLTFSQLSVLIDTVITQRVGVRDTRIMEQLGTLTTRLNQQRESVNRFRFAPIVVVGNDPSAGILRDVCRDLGERLAAVELGVLTGNPTFGSWLAEGYRQYNPDLQSFVIFRRRDDSRPPREGVNYHAVEGDLAALREEMLSHAKGVIIVSGGKGTFKEYLLAGKKDIPVIPLRLTGGAAAELAPAAIPRLKQWGIAPAVIRLLLEDDNVSRIVANTATAMATAIRKQDSDNARSVDQRRAAAALDLEDLIWRIRQETEASPATLEHAEELMRAIGSGRVVWKRPMNVLRRWDKHVQALGISNEQNAYVIELVSRCTYAVVVVELDTAFRQRLLPKDKEFVERAASYDRVSHAPRSVLEDLLRALQALRDAAQMAPERAAILATRLRDDIGFKLIGL
jgi:predicted Rossmann-fold nucleotide-binding protein